MASVVSMVVGLLTALAQPVSAFTCSVCINLVTTYKSAGTVNPAKAVTRLQRNIPVDVPYAIDVDGNLAPIPLGIVPLPGYEMSVLVQATDPNKPTITIRRLGVTPAKLPLKIELISGNLADPSAPRQTVGYDTLDSTAPRSFHAVLDLSDRDHNPATTQALAKITLAGAPNRFTLLEEDFKGDPAGTRIDRATHRLTFFGDGTSTYVPSSIGLDLTSGSSSTHAILTHNLVTNLSFDMTARGGFPETTGLLGPLPTKVDLTLTDVATTDPTIETDKQIDYSASAATSHAELVMASTQSHATTLLVTGLPSVLHVTAVVSPSKTDLTYHANAKATHAFVVSTSDTGAFSADVAGVPANISDLSSTSTANGGTFEYVADSRATRATLTSEFGAQVATADVTGVPSAIAVGYSSLAGEGHYHYSTGGDLATHATLSYLDQHGQQYVLDADQIPSTLNVDYVATHTGDQTNGTDNLAFTYHASSSIPHVQLHATNLTDLIDRATQMNVTLDGVPTDFGLNVAQQRSRTTVASTFIPDPCISAADAQNWDPQNGPLPPICPDPLPAQLYQTFDNVSKDIVVSATTSGGRLGHGAFLITSGVDDELAATSDTGAPIDGVLYRDIADRFVISGRISEFSGLTAHQVSAQTVTTTPDYYNPTTVTTNPLQDTLHAELDTDAPTHFLQFVIDKQPHDGSAPIDETVVRLAGLPTHISIDTNSDAIDSNNDLNQQTLHTSTTWRASSSVKGYTTSAGYQSGFELTHSSIAADGTATNDEDVQIDPMPKNFTACQDTEDDACSQGVFDANLTAAHNGPTASQVVDACTQHGYCGTFAPWYYRTWVCLGAETCLNPTFDEEPGDANQGSLGLQADEPITLSYVSGDYVNQVGTFDELNFTNLTRFALQAHDTGQYDCGSTIGTCQFGTIDLDTDGHSITGSILTNSIDFNFPDGFSASQLIWDFKKTGSASGRLATMGALICPSGTVLKANGTERAAQICTGNLLP